MKRIVELFLDPIRMINDIRSELSQGLGLWGPALNVPQLLGGLYYIRETEGWVILLFWFLMIMTAGSIHRNQRFSRLIGVSQSWWLLILPFLYVSAVQKSEFSVFSIWLWYVCITMTISVLLDAFDFHRYITTEDKTYKKR